MSMTRRECQEHLMGGGALSHVEMFATICINEQGLVVNRNGIVQVEDFNPWHPRFVLVDWQKHEPKHQPVSRLVRHGVYPGGDGFLRASGSSLDCWLGRNDLVGFQFDGCDKICAEPVQYMSKIGGRLFSYVSPSLLESGEWTEVHPVAVWQRVTDDK